MEHGEDGRRWQVGYWPSVRAEEVVSLSLTELEWLLAAQKDHNRALGSEEDLRAFFSALSEYNLNAFATRLHARIVDETGILDRFSRLGLYPFAPDLLALPLPYPVRVVPAAGGLVQSGARACYREGAIHLAGEPPSLAERLILLASRGIIANDLFHEVFHGLQDDGQEFHSLDEVMDAVAAAAAGRPDHKVALAEAHAWLCCLPGFRHDRIADIIRACYQVDGDGLQGAIALIYGLAVLGLDDEQIGRLVAQATWCSERGIYVDLVRERDRLLEMAGWTLADLDDAVSRQHLVERLQVLRAIGIARQLAREAFEYRQAEVDLAGVAG